MPGRPSLLPSHAHSLARPPTHPPTLSPLPPQVYIIEANPRASRTVPFVAKAIGHPLAAYASLLMSGKTLAELGFTEVRARAASWEASARCARAAHVAAVRQGATQRPAMLRSYHSNHPVHQQPLPLPTAPHPQEPKLNHVAVKEAVLPFDKFAGADTLLGPEMRSTGEVGGVGWAGG